MSGPVRSPVARRVLLALYALGAVAYLAWRIAFTLSGAPPLWAGAFLVAEVWLVCASLAFYVLILDRSRPAPRPPSPHSIDVFIATYDEPVALLRTTAVAARDMALPHRTFLCDDGDRAEVAALAATIGVEYLRRPDNTDFKAGNLNHAVSRTSGALILVLDADHVPRRTLLERLVGQFDDPQVALVQTPQVFYNGDSFQHPPRDGVLWHEATLFHHGIQPGADRLNAAFFVGTGAVLRRTAIERIGGFATGTITEDVHTSMRLHAAGYRSVYIDEDLGYLLAPETPLAYARQRLRWGRGAMQLLRWENPLWVPGLTPSQRLAYTHALSHALTAWPNLVFYLAPALYLLFGLSPVAVDPGHGLPVFMGHVAFDLAIWALLAAPHARLFQAEVYKVVNLPVHLRATLRLVMPHGLTFQVTPKTAHAGLPPSTWLPAAALVALNGTALVVGPMRWAAGQAPLAVILFAGAFAGLYLAAALTALRRAIGKRRAPARSTAPVALAATVGVGAEVVPALLRRLAGGHAEIDLPQAPGRELWLRVPGLVPEPVRAGVVWSRRAGRRWHARLHLPDLSPADHDRLDRWVFNRAVPRALRGAAPTRNLGPLLLALVCIAAPARAAGADGWALLAVDEPGAAEAAFLEVLEADPADLAAAEGLVWCAFSRGDLALAARRADARLSLSDDPEWRDKRLGVLAHLPDRRGEAIAAYQARSRAHPEDPEAWRALAATLEWDGRLAQAAQAWSTTVALDPSDDASRLRYARVLSWLGRLDDSLAEYDALLRSYPALRGERDRVASWAPPAAERSRLSLSSGDLADSAGFAHRRVSVSLEHRPYHDTVLTVEPRWSHLSDRDDTVDLLGLVAGAEHRQGALVFAGGYGLHVPFGIAPTHAAHLSAGVDTAHATVRVSARRRSLLDAPADLPLESLGHAGMTVAGVRARVQVSEAALHLSARGEGLWAFADGRRGAVDGGIRRDEAVAGAGWDALHPWGDPAGHALVARYVVYGLSASDPADTWFSPRSFVVHTPAIAWRWDAAPGSTFSAEAGVPFRGARHGLLLGAGFQVEVGGLRLEGQGRWQDDTTYRSTQVRVALGGGW